MGQIIGLLGLLGEIFSDLTGIYYHKRTHNKNLVEEASWSYPHSFWTDCRYPQAIYYYQQTYNKMVEVLEAAFGDYPNDGYTFVPVEDQLARWYYQLYQIHDQLDNRKDIAVHKMFQFKEHKTLHDLDPLEQARTWNYYTRNPEALCNYSTDQKQLEKLVIKPYDLPADLSEIFKKLDPLIQEHQQRKSQILAKGYDVLSWRDLRINLTTATLHYLPNFQIPIPLEKTEMKVLTHLLKQKPKVVTYKEIEQVSGRVNQSNRDINYLIRDTKTMLRNLGLPSQLQDQIKGEGMIQNVKNVGYQIKD